MTKLNFTAIKKLSVGHEVHQYVSSLLYLRLSATTPCAILLSSSCSSVGFSTRFIKTRRCDTGDSGLERAMDTFWLQQLWQISLRSPGFCTKSPCFQPWCSRIFGHLRFARGRTQPDHGAMGSVWELLRRIPLNVRAISAKNIFQKTTRSTVTF